MYDNFFMLDLRDRNNLCPIMIQINVNNNRCALIIRVNNKIRRAIPTWMVQQYFIGNHD